MSGFKLSNDFAEEVRPEGQAQTHRGAWESPLSMVVHSVASTQPAQALEAKQRRRGRSWMLLVWLICAAPVVASYLTFYIIRPQATRSYGELVEPQRPLPDLSGVALGGQDVNLTSLKGQWLLLSVAGGDCNAACQPHLYLQRQLRESMGKEKERVDWVWLVSDQAKITPALLPALRSAVVLRVPETGLQSWLSPASGHQLADHLYVVDPLGHLMMRFPADLEVQDAAKAKRDLERLLRASASWDRPGR